MHFIQSLWGGVPLQIRIVLSGSCPLASNETLAAYYYPMHTSCQIIKIMRVHLHCLRATVDSHAAHRLENVVHFSPSTHYLFSLYLDIATRVQVEVDTKLVEASHIKTRHVQNILLITFS